jgi:hypothetical protein
MTQEERIDKTIEIAARIASAIFDAPKERGLDGGFDPQNVSTICVQYAKAIISEAEKEYVK